MPVNVQKLCDKGTVFIIGGGPSLKGFDFSKISDKHIIGVNNAFMLGDFVDVCWFGDVNWYERNKSQLDNFKGLKYHCCNRSASRPDTIRYTRGKPQGIDKDPTKVAWNNNSGGSAINLAYHLGAARIILLGFDMKFNEFGENNWHDYHVKRDPKWNPYYRFLKCFPMIAHDAKKLGIEIINTSLDSALNMFPKKSIDEVLT